MLEKRKTEAFGKDIYLLGRASSGRLLWLKGPSFDCGWYWGFGYVETYTNDQDPSKSKDIESHFHFDSLTGSIEGRNYYHLNGSSAMDETVLTDSESLELTDLMKQFYVLKEAAAIFHRGNAHITVNSIDNKDPEIVKTINERVLPRIFARVEELLTP